MVEVTQIQESKPVEEQKKLPAYSVRAENYHSDNGTESLLMLGLSHTDSDSTHRRTEWMYKDNPAGQAVVCTVRHNPSDKDIGVLAICRRQIKTASGTKEVGIFCDLVTDKSHRTLGPAIQLMQEALNIAKPMGLDRIYGWPNEKSFVLFKRFPTAELGQIGIYRRYFDWVSIFSDRMPRLPAALFGKLMNWADHACLLCHQAFAKRRYRLEPIDAFDDSFNGLWANVSGRYDEIGVRDAEFLNWRFRQSSDSAHRVLAMRSVKSNHLLGYVVYRELSQQFVDISDFMAVDSRSTERSLIRSFCLFAKSAGYEKVSLHFRGNKASTRNLWSCGFIKVSSQPSVVFEFSPDERSQKPMQTHVTQADHDVG